MEKGSTLLLRCDNNVQREILSKVSSSSFSSSLHGYYYYYYYYHSPSDNEIPSPAPESPSLEWQRTKQTKGSGFNCVNLTGIPSFLPDIHKRRRQRRKWRRLFANFATWAPSSLLLWIHLNGSIIIIIVYQASKEHLNCSARVLSLSAVDGPQPLSKCAQEVKERRAFASSSSADDDEMGWWRGLKTERGWTDWSEEDSVALGVVWMTPSGSYSGTFSLSLHYKWANLFYDAAGVAAPNEDRMNEWRTVNSICMQSVCDELIMLFSLRRRLCAKWALLIIAKRGERE